MAGFEPATPSSRTRCIAGRPLKYRNISDFPYFQRRLSHFVHGVSSPMLAPKATTASCLPTDRAAIEHSLFEVDMTAADGWHQGRTADRRGSRADLGDHQNEPCDVPTAFPAVMVDGRSQILKFAAGRSRASMRCGAARSAPRSLWAAPSDYRFYRSRTAGLADAGQPGRAGLGGPCRCGRRPLPRHSPWLKAIPTCGNVCAKLRVRRSTGWNNHASNNSPTAEHGEAFSETRFSHQVPSL